jgi:hypothetical protein
MRQPNKGGFMNSNWRKCLGEVLSRFYQLGLNTIECHEDVSRWNAPSECHGDVNRGYDDAVENAFEKAFVQYGIRSMEELMQEFRDRTLGYKSYEIFCIIFYGDISHLHYDRRYEVPTA